MSCDARFVAKGNEEVDVSSHAGRERYREHDALIMRTHCGVLERTAGRLSSVNCQQQWHHSEVGCRGVARVDMYETRGRVARNDWCPVR
jgi:hypothetical protein